MNAEILSSVARYVFAHNQSAAAVVLDPIYRVVSRALLRGAVPLSGRLVDRRYPTDLYTPYRERARRLQYFIEDWDFGDARPELLTARERQVVHTITLGETSGMAVSDGFLRAFRTSPELASFFGTWFVEELNHFRGFHRYTERMGEAWPADRVDAVAEIEFRPYSDDPMEIAACNMFQELLAYLIYRSLGSHVGDPFLGQMISQFAKDELRHFKFYQDVVGRQIQRDSGFRVTVLKVFLKATTPFNQVAGGWRPTLDHLANGLHYFRRAEYAFFLDQVEFLLGTSLEPLFAGCFEIMTAACEHCARKTFQCDCSEFGDRARTRS